MKNINKIRLYLDYIRREDMDRHSEGTDEVVRKREAGSER